MSQNCYISQLFVHLLIYVPFTNTSVNSGCRNFTLTLGGDRHGGGLYTKTESTALARHRSLAQCIVVVIEILTDNNSCVLSAQWLQNLSIYTNRELIVGRSRQNKTCGNGLKHEFKPVAFMC